MGPNVMLANPRSTGPLDVGILRIIVIVFCFKEIERLAYQKICPAHQSREPRLRDHLDWMPRASALLFHLAGDQPD
jgi:hypothetical protein